MHLCNKLLKIQVTNSEISSLSQAKEVQQKLQKVQNFPAQSTDQLLQRQRRKRRNLAKISTGFNNQNVHQIDHALYFETLSYSQRKEVAKGHK